MAKPKARRLKVFQAQFGFFDTVVAAPSQAAALRAWGTHQNLFASGQALVTTDEAAVAAAVAHPETPLRRAVGTSDPFKLDPVGLPDVPEPKNKPHKPPKTLKVPASPPTPKRPPADRSKLDAAEAAVRALDKNRKTEEAALRREAAALEARISAAQEAYVEARKAATAEVVAAREAYREAGGRD